MVLCRGIACLVVGSKCTDVSVNLAHWSYTLKMVAVVSSETSAHFCLYTRHYKLEYLNIHVVFNVAKNQISLHCDDF